jgi:hypothetical protein
MLGIASSRANPGDAWASQPACARCTAIGEGQHLDMGRHLPSRLPASPGCSACTAGRRVPEGTSLHSRSGRCSSPGASSIPRTRHLVHVVLTRRQTAETLLVCHGGTVPCRPHPICRSGLSSVTRRRHLTSSSGCDCGYRCGRRSPGACPAWTVR